MTSSMPALLGGIPVRPEGPPDWPIADPVVQQALAAAYADGSWGKYDGGHVAKLESELADFHQVAHVLTCGSGTFAIELALRALKVGAGDEVVMAAYDYPGNFLTIHAIGAMPALVDVHCENWNINPEPIRAVISEKTKAMIVSHLHGGIVPMREVMKIASERGVPVIEDAAQCPGAMIQGKRAGTWGDVGILSFGGSKLLTAGRGGALLTSDGAIHQRARLAQNRGNVVNPLSELQAAVLLPQLHKLDARNEQRQRGVARVQDGLRDVPGLRLFANTVGEASPGHYKVGFQFRDEAFGLSRDRFVTALRAEGIAFDEGFRALHVQRSPSRFERAGSLEEASRAHLGCVILHHPVLLGGPDEIEQVVTAVRKVWQHRDKL